MKTKHRWKMMRKWSFLTLGCLLGVLNPLTREPVEATSLGGPSHIGTFDGSTTFTTSSSNGINPGLYLEVMDEYGNYHEYTSEDGVITIPGTQEGAYVTQAKLLGKTKYRDQDTGELLDEWEEGRNLTLESVQMPVLTTTGKNLVNLDKSNPDGLGSNSGNGTSAIEYDNDKQGFYTKTNRGMCANVVLKPNTYYTISADFLLRENNGYSFLWQNPTQSAGDTYNSSDFSPTEWRRKSITRMSDENGKINWVVYGGVYFKNLQIEEGSTATTYEPYKSNILSTSEDVVLRGFDSVEDTLNLNTGEYVKRIGELTLDGSEPWVSANNTDGTIRFNLPISDFKNYDTSSNGKNLINNKLPKANFSISGNTYGVSTWCNHVIFFTEHTNVNDFKQWLSQNPTTIQYELETPVVKTVALNSTYYFQPVLNRSVEVNGTVLPLVYSVTVPTDPLSFVLNPNAEEGQRFIAPTFTITNDTPASIQIELKAFEQTTNTFRDVLPTKYQDWSQLSKDQSKDFALALLPVPSEGWASLKEGPRYVADSSNYDLGEIKAESSVDFTFTASHGRAFVERLNPQYRLSFIFGF